MKKINKTVKYKISEDEDIGNIPYEAIILNAKILYLGDNNDGLLYLPGKTKYIYEGKAEIEQGCECLSFAKKDGNDIWIKSHEDYINLIN